MKMLYSSDDIRVMGAVQSALDGAGIAYEVQNDTIPYPGPVFYPEVWVDDSDFDRACELRKIITEELPVIQNSWICPSCGERLEGQFASCWKCGANRN